MQSSSNPAPTQTHQRHPQAWSPAAPRRPSDRSRKSAANPPSSPEPAPAGPTQTQPTGHPATTSPLNSTSPPPSTGAYSPRDPRSRDRAQTHCLSSSSAKPHTPPAAHPETTPRPKPTASPAPDRCSAPAQWPDPQQTSPATKPA